MILNKKNFTQQKYNELVSYANLNNCIIEDKGEYYETVEIKIVEPTLEELKANKKAELKQKRDEYKSKNSFSQFVYENLEFNLIEDVDNEKAKWRTFLQNLIKQYDNYKNQINLAQSKEELDNINIVFNNNGESYYE